jgi:hypothetical protein
MFAQVELAVGGKSPVLTVPDSAVIDTGTRRIVLVQVGEGRFEPREVELGARGENYVEVIKGVSDGEQVVVAANFLIDAESNLKAAVGGLGGHAGHGSPGLRSRGSGGGCPRAAPLTPATRRPAPAIGHKAEGTVDSVDPKNGTLSLNHGPSRPEVAGDDDGVQGRERVAAAAAEARPGRALRVRRAPARRVRRDVDRPAAPGPGAAPRPSQRRAPSASRRPSTHSGH